MADVSYNLHMDLMHLLQRGRMNIEVRLHAGAGFPGGMMMPGAAGMPVPAGIPGPGLAGPVFGGLDSRSADGNAFAHPSAPDFGDLPAGINVEEARYAREGQGLQHVHERFDSAIYSSWQSLLTARMLMSLCKVRCLVHALSMASRAWPRSHSDASAPGHLGDGRKRIHWGMTGHQINP